MNDNGYWRQRKKPNPEEDVLITFIHNEKPYVCIGQFFPKGYEVDWLPIERECDFVKHIDDTYPDFTQGYSLSQIEAWCNEYKIELKVNYVETSEYPAGTIYKQSREKSEPKNIS